MKTRLESIDEDCGSCETAEVQVRYNICEQFDCGAVSMLCLGTAVGVLIACSFVVWG